MKWSSLNGDSTPRVGIRRQRLARGLTGAGLRLVPCLPNLVIGKRPFLTATVPLPGAIQCRKTNPHAEGESRKDFTR